MRWTVLSGSSLWKQDKLKNRRLSAPVVRRGLVAVADAEGIVHFLSREDGSFSARQKTDGTPVRAPVQMLGSSPAGADHRRQRERNRGAMKPTLVLVGRPNVGKSTLFNRLTKSRDAIVADMPGLTRDRHYGHGKLGKKPYLVVDTGGFEPLVKEGILHEMARQTEQAIAEADAVIFVVDGRTGLTPHDKEIANKLRRIDRPVFVAVNKAEGMNSGMVEADFHELGLGRTQCHFCRPWRRRARLGRTGAGKLSRA
jgi:small GTP-binding protein